jgi:methyl-accepting chemotaxis protein
MQATAQSFPAEAPPLIVPPKRLLPRLGWRAVNVGTRIFAGYLIVLFFMVCMVALAVTQLTNLALGYADLASGIGSYARASDVATTQARGVERAGRAIFADPNVTPDLRAFQSARTQLLASLVTLRAVTRTSEAGSLIDQVATVDATLNDLVTRLRAEVLAGAIADPTSAYMDQAQPVYRQFDILLQQVDELEQRAQDAHQAAITAAVDQTRIELLSGVAIALLIGLLLAFHVTRSITIPLALCLRALEHLGRGDLRVTVPSAGRDELAALSRALNGTATALRDLSSQIHQTVDHLAPATAEIMAATTQQSVGATEQAAAIAETTATVEETRAAAAQSAEWSGAVITASQENLVVAQEGERALGEAAEAMQEIKTRVQAIADQTILLLEHTQQIGDIIALVSDLADESKLLSLNAAIEASRAGEQGKGFTVVATEIRSLAERSTAATTQVGQILSEIQRATNQTVLATEAGTRQVDVGTQLIERAAATIVQLTASSQESAERARDSNVSCTEIARAMDQIASAMMHINHATADSEVAGKHTRRITQDLQGLAGQLDQLVDRYQL